MLVGAVKLRQYLDKHKIKSAIFARELGKFPSTIHRVLSGDNCPDLLTSTLIEEYTKGAVTRDDWLVTAPAARKK
jgi:hypothetical protein